MFFVCSFSLFYLGTNLEVIEAPKRKTCKVPEMNRTLEIGANWVDTDNCEVYWCSEETHRYGDLFKYRYVRAQLRHLLKRAIPFEKSRNFNFSAQMRTCGAQIISGFDERMSKTRVFETVHMG